MAQPSCDPLVSLCEELVINEADVDDWSSDLWEFVELYNPGLVPVPLADKTVELLDWAGVPYATFNLADVYNTNGDVITDLMPGQYLVLGTDRLFFQLAPDTPRLQFDYYTLQNGYFGIRIRGDAIDPAGSPYTVDAISFGAQIPGASEGYEAAAEDDALSSTDWRSASRCGNGVDRDQNGLDFTLRPWTAGRANACGRLVVNEVDLDQGDPDGWSFIELLNAGSEPWPAAGLQLQLFDSTGLTLGTLDLSTLTAQIEPGQYLTVGDPLALTQASGQSTTSLTLATVLPAGIAGARLQIEYFGATYPLDAATFGASIADVVEGSPAGPDSLSLAGDPRFSVSRCIDGADSDDNARDYQQAQSTPGGYNACGRLVINEVDYNQAGGDAWEFVEIFNAGSVPVDLAGIRLETATTAGPQYTWPLTDSGAQALAPGEYLLVGTDTYMATLPASLPTIGVPMYTFQDTVIGIAVIADVNGIDRTLDSMSYDGPYSGTVPGYTEGTTPAPDDDAVGTGNDGQSISRCLNGLDQNDTGADFRVSAATPGAANTCAVAPSELTAMATRKVAVDAAVNLVTRAEFNSRTKTPPNGGLSIAQALTKAASHPDVIGVTATAGTVGAALSGDVWIVLDEPSSGFTAARFTVYNVRIDGLTVAAARTDVSLLYLDQLSPSCGKAALPTEACAGYPELPLLNTACDFAAGEICTQTCWPDPLCGKSPLARPDWTRLTDAELVDSTGQLTVVTRADFDKALLTTAGLASSDDARGQAMRFAATASDPNRPGVRVTWAPVAPTTYTADHWLILDDYIEAGGLLYAMSGEYAAIKLTLDSQLYLTNPEHLLWASSVPDTPVELCGLVSSEPLVYCRTGAQALVNAIVCAVSESDSACGSNAAQQVCGELPAGSANWSFTDFAQGSVPNACGLATASIWAECGASACQDLCQTQQELCDLVDNNCDGYIDEGQAGQSLPGGPLCQGAVGLCALGADQCDGQGGTQCSVAAVPEACDGLDNDCDGQTDEGVTNDCGACGGTPDETCNGQDDDCDGVVDEFSDGVGCSVGVGTCESQGTEICTAGGLLLCDAVAGSPVAEICDGLDNDCDGQVDEDFNANCSPDFAAIRPAPAPGTLGTTRANDIAALQASGIQVFVDDQCDPAPAGGAHCRLSNTVCVDDTDCDCGGGNACVDPCENDGVCAANPSRSCVPGQVPSACAIGASTAALVSGTVESRSCPSGATCPLANATVRVLNSGQFGLVQTTADGQFTIGMNGNAHRVLTFSAPNHFSVQREVDLRDTNWAHIGRVVLTPADAQVTEVQLGVNAPLTVHVASTVQDDDGVRTTRLYFPSGTTALDGRPSIAVRATEYTIGEEGLDAMPGSLPPTTGYTYAAELSIDDANGPSEDGVEFSTPVFLYVDNFLGFNPGTVVPVGYYDRAAGAWVPIENGMVVRVASVDADGLAVLDTGGESLLPIPTDEELSVLADLFGSGVGQDTFWRSPVPHFTPVDCNYAVTCPEKDGCPNPDVATSLADPLMDSCGDAASQGPSLATGSIIECENQVLRESIPLVGTGLSLNYGSHRALGNESGRIVNIDFPSDIFQRLYYLKRVKIKVTVGSQAPVIRMVSGAPSAENVPDVNGFQYRAAASPSGAFGYFEFTARPGLQTGVVPVRIEIVQYFRGNIATSRVGQPAFGRPGSRSTMILARREIVRSRVTTTPVFMLGSAPFEFGDWTLSGHHQLDVGSGTLLRGDGMWQRTRPLRSDGVIGRVAGNDTGDAHVVGADPDVGVASDLPIVPRHISTDSTGTLYVVDAQIEVIWSIAPDGTKGIAYDFQSNGGAPYATAVGPGDRLFAAMNYRGTRGLYEVLDSGELEQVFNDAGWMSSICDDVNGTVEDPATIGTVYDMVFGPDQKLYFTMVGCHSVFVLSNITSVGPELPLLDVAVGARPLSVEEKAFEAPHCADGAVNGGEEAIDCGGPDCEACWHGVENGPTRCDEADPTCVEARLDSPRGLSFGKDGSLLIADAGNNLIRIVSPDGGEVSTFAGTGESEICVDGNCQGPNCVQQICQDGDGGPAIAARIGSPSWVRHGRGGEVLVLHASRDNPVANLVKPGRVRYISPDGTIRLEVGPSSALLQGSGSSSLATTTPVEVSHGGMVVSADGEVVFGERESHRVRKTTRRSAPPSWLPVEQGELVTPSADGEQAYVFDGLGRHLRTLDTDSGRLIRRFVYTQDGRLAKIVDPFGRETRITRDGPIVRISSPTDERYVDLEVNGSLNRITTSDGREWTMGYLDNTGLLTSLTTPQSRGAQHLFEYDDKGRLISDSNPSMSAGVKISLVPNGADVQKSGPGGTYSYSVDRVQGTRSVTAPDGLVTTTSFSPDGSKVTTLPDGVQYGQSFTFDPRWFGLIRKPSRTVVWFNYDIDGDGVDDSTETTWSYDYQVALDGTLLRASREVTVTEPSTMVSKTQDVYDPVASRIEQRSFVDADGSSNWAQLGATAVREVDAYGRTVRSYLEDPSAPQVAVGPEIRTEFDLNEPWRLVSSTVSGVNEEYVTRYGQRRYSGPWDGDQLSDAPQSWSVDALGKTLVITDVGGLSDTSRVDILGSDEAGLGGDPAASGVVEASTRIDFARVDAQGDLECVGRLCGLTPPSVSGRQTVHAFSYDEIGRETVYAPPDLAGVQSQGRRDYDDSGRLTRFVVSGSGTGNPADERSIDVSYNASRYLAELSYDAATVSMGYDDAQYGRLVSIGRSPVPGFGAQIPVDLQYGYAGTFENSETLSVGGAPVGTWGVSAFDGQGRAIESALSVNGTSTTIGVVRNASTDEVEGFDLDAGQLTVRSNSNAITGQMESVTIRRQGAAAFEVVTTYEYDDLLRLARTTTTQNGQLLFEQTYATRDAAGRITSRDETGTAGVTRQELFTYDALGRLIEVDGPALRTYDYGENSSRIGGPGLLLPPSYDEQDRLLSYGGTTYTYNDAGQLSSSTDSAGTTWSFVYDAVGSLLSAQRSDGTLVEYLVDGLNRRVGRRVDGGDWTYWVYQDQLNPVAELRPDGSWLHFVYYTKSHVPDVVVKRDAQNTVVSDMRVITDQVGTVRALVDLRNGASITADYDEFGVAAGDHSAMRVEIPFGFAGGMADPLTGLVRFGARDYDPRVGRWTAKDPIRFEGGDTNLYGYVGGDPVGRIDPLGLAPGRREQDVIDNTPTWLKLVGDAFFGAYHMSKWAARDADEIDERNRARRAAGEKAGFCDALRDVAGSSQTALTKALAVGRSFRMAGFFRDGILHFPNPRPPKRKGFWSSPF